MAEAVTQALGIVGLDKMGRSLALRARDCGYRVIGTDLNDMPEELAEAGVEEAASVPDLVAKLDPPRTVLLSIPAGQAVDKIAEQLRQAMSEGDIILDGGNSFWGDSKRRAQECAEDGVHFLDCGISGGPKGARNAPCFMVGGPREAVARVEPMLKKMAGESGYVHAGGSGAGHYVKLVHNGVEFGMLQAVGEGVALLEGFPEELAIADTLKCWTSGSVVRGFLVELMAKAHSADPDLDKATSYIEDTDEENWQVGNAETPDTPTPTIAQSVMELVKSRDDDGTAYKAITHMRHEFGGHPHHRDPAIAKERRVGRVEPLHRFENAEEEQ